jgi:hypothetical protein
VRPVGKHQCLQSKGIFESVLKGSIFSKKINTQEAGSVEYLVGLVLILVAWWLWTSIRAQQDFRRGILKGLEDKMELEALARAAGAGANLTDNQHATLDSEWCYASFEEWFNAYKAACASGNPQLGLSENGQSLIDFMDDEPLQRAYRDRVSPLELGKSFARHFNIKTFGG